MSEMRERLAQCLYEIHTSENLRCSWADFDEQWRQIYYGWVDVLLFPAVDTAGYAVVPKEPTEAMYDLGRVAIFRVLFPNGTPFDEADCQAAFCAGWKAGISAITKEAGDER